MAVTSIEMSTSLDDIKKSISNHQNKRNLHPNNKIEYNIFAGIEYYLGIDPYKKQPALGRLLRKQPGCYSREDLIELLLEIDGESRKIIISEVQARSAFNAVGADPGIKLPDSPSVLYKDRPDKGVDPIQFLDDQYGVYMRAGVLYQDELRKLDPHLVPAIHSYCQRMAKRDPENAAAYAAAQHLPPPRKARLDNLVAQDPTGVAAKLLGRKRATNNQARSNQPKIS